MPEFRVDMEAWFQADSQDEANDLADFLGDLIAERDEVHAVANGAAVEEFHGR